MLYKKAAELGNAYAQFNLAELYRTGRVTSKNPDKALYWYRRSADQGTVKAMRKLATIHDKGWLGQPVNKPLAREWARKADAAEARQRREATESDPA